MYINYSKFLKGFLFVFIIIFICLCCIGTIYYKRFLVGGTPFYPNNGVEFDSHSIDFWVTAGSSRKPILDSIYNVYMYIIPGFGLNTKNIAFLEKFGLKKALMKRVRIDSVAKPLSVVGDSVLSLGALKSRHRRKVRFDNIMIPSSVDTILIYLSAAYWDGNIMKPIDTVFSMFRADAKHTGVIDH